MARLGLLRQRGELQYVLLRRKVSWVPSSSSTAWMPVKRTSQSLVIQRETSCSCADTYSSRAERRCSGRELLALTGVKKGEGSALADPADCFTLAQSWLVRNAARLGQASPSVGSSRRRLVDKAMLSPLTAVAAEPSGEQRPSWLVQTCDYLGTGNGSGTG